MFEPFLKLVADYLFETYGNDLSQVTIIAPNKRANLFFNQYLSKHLTDKPIWTPQFTTIGEVFEKLCPLKLADPIQQICSLYEAYKKISNTEESLDKFYSWAELMKSDFDDIDNNLARADMLFKNIEELEKMKDFSFLTENQRKAINSYFGNFNIKPNSELKQRFLSVWDNMYDTYCEYRKLLEKKGLCYSGMLKRNVVEGIKDGKIDLSANLNDGTYVVIGFNVLNETEKALFKSIKQERTTLFFWDYDEKYLESEAGRFIKENIRTFGNSFENHPEYYNNFGHQNHVRFVKSPTENAQSRYVNQWIDEKVTNHPLQESVIVLCNENVLQPVLHSIPYNADGTNLEMNVTMGYPLSETPIYSFVSALAELQMHGFKGGNTWKYTSAAVVLKHPYTQRMVGDKAIEILLQLKKRNVMFPKFEDLTTLNGTDENGTSVIEEVDFLKKIFTPALGHLALIEYLMDIVKSLGLSYKNEMLEMKKSKDTDFELQLYAESIYTTHKVLSRIHTIQECEPTFNVNNSTLSRLLMQMLQQQSIPFHGEPAIGLQVMGLLETRNLDFRNVLMLSVNEGQLPKQERLASLIPYSLRDAYGMTTIEKQVSLYAFYFYNLLQRAEDVTVMYNCTADVNSKGEMSRFMMQLQVEQKKFFGDNNKIELLSLFAPNSSQENVEVEIEKTPEVFAKLKKMKKISPSAINSYIDCPVQFYFKFIAKFKEEDEVTEEVDNKEFGNIFHTAMEMIYKSFGDRLISSGDLTRIADDNKYVTSVVENAFAKEFFKKDGDLAAHKIEYSGEQLLNKHVIIDYVKNQLLFDAKSCPMKIIGIEKYVKTLITLNDGETEVEIGGIIDRYERLYKEVGSNVVRITDYKTNASVQKGKTLAGLFDETDKKRAYNYLQALYYCEVVARSEKLSEPIMPALMYIKSALGTRDYHLELGEPITDYISQCQGEYRELLIDKLSEIYLSNKPFVRNESHCEFCEFKSYCKK